MNPMIQQQIEHIHAKANQQRPTYIKRGDTDQDNKMVGANGYGPAEPANYDPCFQLPESPTHCNRNTSKSVGFDDAAYSGGPGHGIALTSETSSHTLQYDNGPIHGMPDASPAYLPRAYYVDGPNGVKPEQFRISAKAARNASRPAQDMYLRSPALDYASYSFESQAHGIPAIPLVPNSGGYVIHKSAYDTDDWTGGLEHAKVVHELADILQELEVTMSIQIETIARAGQKLCRIAKSLKTKKGDRKEEKGAYEAHGCEIATPGKTTGFRLHYTILRSQQDAR